MLKIVLTLLSTTLLFSEQITHSNSFQGYTGLINTPNAQVMNEGDLSFSFNNQFDNHLRQYDYSKPESYSEDYVFGAGLLPGLEIQGRFKEQNGYTRDLSANVKYKIPKLNDFLPDIAIGVQDLGGAASNYENYYIVADKEFWFLRASLGYGYSNIKKSVAARMDGLFGGLEAEVMPWLSVMGEYDGEESQAAARFFMPEDWVEGLKVHFTVASNLSNGGNMSYMINAIWPLGKKEKYLVSLGDAPSSATDGQFYNSGSTLGRGTNADVSLQSLVDNLTDGGLQNVTVGSRGDTLYIAYENTIYLHNELDAIAFVLHKAALLSERYHYFVIEPKHSNVTVASISGSLEKATEFFASPSFETKQAFIASLQENSYEGDWFIYKTDVNSGRLRPRIVLSPVLTKFVGTEVAAFDYQLLLGTKLYVNLYDGLDFTFRYDIPVSNSENFDPEYGVFGTYYSDGGVYSTMLNYSNRIKSGINTLSAGSYEFDYVGVMDQFIYHIDEHTFKVKLGYFRHYDDSDDTRAVYLAKYTYQYTPMDIFVEVQAGKYWYQDVGFSVAAKRYFGDVAVELKYLQTSDTDYRFFQSEGTNKYFGIAIELPLDFKKSHMIGKYAQINGDTNWRFRLRTTVGRSDGSNQIVPDSGYDPVLEIESENYFYNRNRLSLDYVKENTERLLENF